MNDFTVKQYAMREQVDPRTVRRWILKGAVEIRRTPGGGIRILDERSAVVVFNMTNDDKERHP